MSLNVVINLFLQMDTGKATEEWWSIAESSLEVDSSGEEDEEKHSNKRLIKAVTIY